jgi:hypothetical protein
VASGGHGFVALLALRTLLDFVRALAEWPLSVAVATLVILIWQTFETRRAVNVARDTLVSTFRPKIIFRSVSLCPGTMIPTDCVPDDKPWGVLYVIANVGGANARITRKAFAVKMFDSDALPSSLPYPRWAEEPEFILAPGEEKAFLVPLEAEAVNLFRVMGGIRGGHLSHQKTAHLHFFGVLIYIDGRGIFRKMSVLRHYNTETGRFDVVADPENEYSD